MTALLILLNVQAAINTIYVIPYIFTRWQLAKVYKAFDHELAAVRETKKNKKKEKYK